MAHSSPTAGPARTPPPPERWSAADAVNLGGLGLFSVALLVVSWRKWPDAVIDFGREVYVPWRLTQGAVLYRDVQLFYGPFSKYFNALIFKTLGVGLSSLIWVNLAIYAAILVLLYTLVRAGWGRLAALAAGVVFVGMFSFVELLPTGNFNFVLPYAHEATHGILLTLGLIVAVRSAVLRTTKGKILTAGLLAGLTVLVKPEFILAGAAVCVGGLALLALKARADSAAPPWPRWTALFLLGGIAPMLVATGLFWFWAGVPLRNALHFANNAWVTIFTYPSMAGEPIQKYALGNDAVSANFLHELLWGGAAVGLACAVGWGCRRFAQSEKSTAAGLGIFLGAAVLALGYAVPWVKIGAVLPGLLLLAAVLEALKIRQNRWENSAWPAGVTRVLLWLAGAALLARMPLNPRIYDYGFFQAPLAAAIGVATLLEAAPEYFRLEDRSRKIHQAFFLAVLVLCTGSILLTSQHWYALKTLAVGTGDDRFWAYEKSTETSGTIVEFSRQYLANDPGAHTLLVLPEGSTINYLTRLPATTPEYLLVPELMEGGRAQAMLERLRAHPPDRVVLVSRQMRDFGLDWFGESPGHGALLIDFVKNNYQMVYHEGHDPLDPDHDGLAIYARRPGPPPAGR